VLRILSVIANNFRHEPATVRLPETLPAPEGFRGAVVMDTSRCLACGMCSYVCISDAIQGAQQADGYEWRYKPGRCTFCGRCAERCPGHALTMDPKPVPAYSKSGELDVVHRVAFTKCPECGAPTRPVTEELISRAFAHANDEVRQLVHLCERCRRRRLQSRMKVTPEEEKQK
jgi:formate hydrogenlyase subunit 6/NADH:ubiquinone oxidoreductase subunit I